MKECLLGLSQEELKNLITKMGEKSFRAGQIFKALHQGKEFEEMTELSKPLRERLEEKYDAQSVKIIKSIKSVDGTEKFLFSLKDGNLIEGVLMRYKHGASLCVSTQVGCRMRCAFCASGLDGLIRNLTPAEILGEVIAVNKYEGGLLGENRKVINAVGLTYSIEKGKPDGIIMETGAQVTFIGQSVSVQATVYDEHKRPLNEEITFSSDNNSSFLIV